MAFIAIIHITDHTASDGLMSPDINWPAGSQLVGMYEFPSRHELKCTGNCIRGKTGAWHRNPKGFMECAICGSRNKRVRRWFTDALFDWFGANLMKDNAPALFRTPDGYGPRTTD